ncbi:vanadium-dependent haloperoxidase [Saccharothrix luteola]|uniref:vanadium-dependent haloperoxidase n=1 Tax=Saccharothrix luteola TaxID=2893018 RepID=UPI001E44B504|nr:vanadium-dependent haloperoxidase [Saccharothrix luteola]MCC8246341.1 vanadium-dependent haloperoxidase [Saccharothrix luteola]
MNRVFVLVLAGIFAVVGAAPAAGSPQHRVDVVAEWFDVTAATVAAAGASAQSTNSRTWAIGWLAAARAAHDVPAAHRTRADAAVASALHTALVALAPTRRAELDAALRTTLDRLTPGGQRDLGVADGIEEARDLLAERQGDGLAPASVNAPFELPSPAPGVWQPTPPSLTPPQQAGNRLARPFVLARADQFRLPPPPALDSPRDRIDLAEVRAYGAVNSTVRTASQTATAQFWLQSSAAGYTQPLRAAVTQLGGPPARRAALVAAFHVILVDTQIATSDTKYAYLRWRPITAIRATVDPQWTPLHDTPAHPDYPSGHNTYAGAAEVVLTAFTGPSARRPFTATSPTAPGVTRTYQRWADLTKDNVDARVWSGIHTRSADEAGVVLGRRVAEHGLSRFASLLG